MRSVAATALLLLIFFSCRENKIKNGISKNQASPNIQESFFYPYDTIPRIYQYRDIVHGMREQFHRVYGIRDGYGTHVIVEKYADGRRLTEAYNYSLDSLRVWITWLWIGWGRMKKH